MPCSSWWSRPLPDRSCPVCRASLTMPWSCRRVAGPTTTYTLQTDIKYTCIRFHISIHIHAFIQVHSTVYRMFIIRYYEIKIQTVFDHAEGPQVPVRWQPVLGLSLSFSASSLLCNSWWRHQMETFTMLLALCAGNSPVTGEFPSQRPVTRSFNVFFDRGLNKRLNKQ